MGFTAHIMIINESAQHPPVAAQQHKPLPSSHGRFKTVPSLRKQQKKRLPYWRVGCSPVVVCGTASVPCKVGDMYILAVVMNTF